MFEFSVLVGVLRALGWPSGSIRSGLPAINCAAFEKSAIAFGNSRTVM